MEHCHLSELTKLVLKWHHELLNAGALPAPKVVDIKGDLTRTLKEHMANQFWYMEKVS